MVAAEAERGSALGDSRSSAPLGESDGELSVLWAILDALPDIIFVKDRQGCFVLTNMALAHLKGRTNPQDLVGLTDYDFSPPEVARQYREDDQAVMESGRPILDRDEPAADVGGEVEWLATTKVPWRDAAGDVVGVIGIGRDITRQKQAELALQQHQALLAATVAARTQELRQANERLQAEVDERRRAEEALALERNLLRTLIDNLPDLTLPTAKAGGF